MKFEFATEQEMDPRVIREMLNRGYRDLKSAIDEENRKHSIAQAKIPHVLDATRFGFEEKRHTEVMEKLRAEENLWKQVLVTFSRVNVS